MYKRKNNDSTWKWSPKKMKLSFNSVSVMCVYVCVWIIMWFLGI